MKRQSKDEKTDHSHLLEVLRLRLAVNRYTEQRRRQLSQLKRQIESKRPTES